MNYTPEQMKRAEAYFANNKPHNDLHAEVNRLQAREAEARVMLRESLLFLQRNGATDSKGSLIFAIEAWLAHKEGA